MRGSDRGNTFRRRVVVEQDVAAAIDLDVDKAGREPGPLGELAPRDRGGQVAPRDQPGNGGALDDDRAAAMQRLTVEYGISDDRMPSGFLHRVRVTFCRWRGRSGSIPSRAASRTSIA